MKKMNKSKLAREVVDFCSQSDLLKFTNQDKKSEAINNIEEQLHKSEFVEELIKCGAVPEFRTNRTSSISLFRMIA